MANHNKNCALGCRSIRDVKEAMVPESAVIPAPDGIFPAAKLKTEAALPFASIPVSN